MGAAPEVLVRLPPGGFREPVPGAIQRGILPSEPSTYEVIQRGILPFEPSAYEVIHWGILPPFHRHWIRPHDRFRRLIPRRALRVLSFGLRPP